MHVAPLFAALLFLASATVPADIGGKTIRFGRSIVVAVPAGWYRATPDLEKEAEAWVLLYAGKTFNPDAGDMPYGYVHLNFEIDEMESAAQLADFYRNVATRLTKSGWRAGEITLAGKTLACYTTEDADSTTILVQIPFGLRSVTTYTIVPKRGAGMPKYALRLLEAITLR